MASGLPQVRAAEGGGNLRQIKEAEQAGLTRWEWDTRRSQLSTHVSDLGNRVRGGD